MIPIKDGEVEVLKKALFQAQEAAKLKTAEADELCAVLNEIAFSNKTKTGLKEMARKALGFVS